MARSGCQAWWTEVGGKAAGRAWTLIRAGTPAPALCPFFLLRLPSMRSLHPLARGGLQGGRVGVGELTYRGEASWVTGYSV